MTGLCWLGGQVVRWRVLGVSMRVDGARVSALLSWRSSLEATTGGPRPVPGLLEAVVRRQLREDRRWVVRCGLLVVESLVAGTWVVGLVADAVVIKLRLRKRAVRIVQGVVGLRVLVLREASLLGTVVPRLQEPSVVLAGLHWSRLTSFLYRRRHHVQVLQTRPWSIRDGHHVLPHHDPVLGP